MLAIFTVFILQCQPPLAFLSVCIPVVHCCSCLWISVAQCVVSPNDWLWPSSGGLKSLNNALKLWTVKFFPDHIVLNGSPLTQTVCVNYSVVCLLPLPTTGLYVSYCSSSFEHQLYSAYQQAMWNKYESGFKQYAAREMFLARLAAWLIGWHFKSVHCFGPDWNVSKLLNGLPSMT